MYELYALSVRQEVPADANMKFLEKQLIFCTVLI